MSKGAKDHRRQQPPPLDLDPRVRAAVALIGRTGAAEFQIRYCDDDQPVVWVAAAYWSTHQCWEAAAAMNAPAAIFRLCTQVIDGGTCTHCSKPTVFTEDSDTTLLDLAGCVYAWDPELRTYRRGCEGDQ